MSECVTITFMKSVVCGTGHRPDKLIGGWANWQKHYLELTDLIVVWLEENKPDSVISGMALGWDLALANATLQVKIPLSAYIPCPNQELKWSKVDQIEYNNLLEKADNITYISEYYTNWCMQKRNEAMVEDSNLVLALFDGSSGGTKNCVDFAKKKNKEIINLWKVYQDLFKSEI